MATERSTACGGGPPRSPSTTAPEPSEGAAGSKPSGSQPAGLVVVATPIGNAADITLRALDILARVDAVACEDSRVTGRLLARHGVSAKLIPYHDHNAARARPALMKRLKNGESVALVSDAGTPLVSDPGYRLVRACIDDGIPVTAVPGPSAVLTSLMVAGLPTDRFLFAGFLPNRGAARRRALTDVAEVPASLVFMESARRLPASLADMADILGSRSAAVTREMTKMFEEVRRDDLAALAAHYREAGSPKGEVTIVVAPPLPAGPPDAAEVDRLLAQALAEASVRDAATRVAQATGLKRRDLYARALDLDRQSK